MFGTDPGHGCRARFGAALCGAELDGDVNEGAVCVPKLSAGEDGRQQSSGGFDGMFRCVRFEQGGRQWTLTAGFVSFGEHVLLP